MTSNQRKNLENLSELLKGRGLRQEDIAARLGVSQAHVNQLLNGKTPFGKKTAARWADEFGLSAAWLLTGEGDMLCGGVIQNNENGDNFNGEQIVLKDGDTHEFFAVIERKDKQIEEKDRQINRLLSIIEKMQGL